MAVSAEIDFADGTAVGNLDVSWIHGSAAAKYNTDPDIQVHAYDEHTYVLRQNKAVHYEAPFMFLLFGNSRAVLLDTGATAEPRFFPLRRTVDEIIDGWLDRHPHPTDYGLLVLHTHAHGDHIAADGQFTDRPNTVVVEAKHDAAWAYFGFTDEPGTAEPTLNQPPSGQPTPSQPRSGQPTPTQPWSDEPEPSRPVTVAEVDLGGRILDCLATPGHHPAAVTYYDRYSQLLLTGDTIYPGRLYVFDWPAFVRSVDRLVEWCAQHPVTHLLGCHIEMTTKPGVDYPVGWNYQPDEPPLQLTPDHLEQLQATLRASNFQPGRYVLPEMIVTPVG